MKVDLKKRIMFFELDADLTLRPKALLNYLQEAATVHSERAGYGSKKLMDQGHAWILHRIGIHIHRPPVLGEELRIHTWHKGVKRFRAYRDFEILNGREKLVSVASLWLFIDLNHKKIIRVPENVSEYYTVEEKHAIDMDIDNWKPSMNYEPEKFKTIAIRHSDYDPLGHVNNALYFDFLENLTDDLFQGERKIKHVVMQFNKEITKSINEVKIGMRVRGDYFEYKLFSPDCVHAAGEFQLFDYTASHTNVPQ